MEFPDNLSLQDVSLKFYKTPYLQSYFIFINCTTMFTKIATCSPYLYYIWNGRKGENCNSRPELVCAYANDKVERGHPFSH